jgi:hypothetical protein
MTLVAAHFIEDKLAVVTDGAGASHAKCGVFAQHGAIVAGWGEYDAPPTFLCLPPSDAPTGLQAVVRANNIAGTLPDPKICRDNFITAFEHELNNSPNVHNGGRGPAGLLLAFAYDCGIEAIVYDANSGKGSWKPRPGALPWPAFFGQDYHARDMLSGIGISSPTEFIGSVASINEFAAKAKDLIVKTSDYLSNKPLPKSVDLPAWLTVLSKDGSVAMPKQVA